jgi:RNA polymerase subunit RPABC4/transcription elongation factor Spt4
MEFRDFFQAAVGALIQQPDEVLVQSAQGNSAILQFLGRAIPDTALVGGFSLLHTFVMVTGFGLLIGASMETSVLIAGFVVLGVAGGLFAVGQVLTIMGVNFTGFSTGMTNALGTLVSQSVLADLYLVLPLLILALGVARWRQRGGKRRAKDAAAAHDSMRHYCTFCGSVVLPGSRACGVCHKPVPQASKWHCTNCGRLVPEKAVYCWFCGAGVKWTGFERCPNCKELADRTSKFCVACGARLEWGPRPPVENDGSA